MKVKLDRGAIMPTRAHLDDAGLDLYAPHDFCLYGGNMVDGKVFIGKSTIDTGVHVEIPRGCVGYIKSKSGLMVKHGIITDGTIDAGYTGSIVVQLFNLTRYDYHFRRGEKIAQLVIHPIITPEPELVDELDETPRGNGGFGSTGK